MKKTYLAHVMLMIVSLFLSCGPAKEKVGDADRLQALNDSAPDLVIERVTFDKDILPLMQKHCVSCHNARSTLGDYSNYRVVSRKKDPIYQRTVVTKDMPTADKPRLKKEEEELIEKWIQSGAPKD